MGQTKVKKTSVQMQKIKRSKGTDQQGGGVTRGAEGGNKNIRGGHNLCHAKPKWESRKRITRPKPEPTAVWGKNSGGGQGVGGGGGGGAKTPKNQKKEERKTGQGWGAKKGIRNIRKNWT